jgi:hypothetical protein
MLESSWPDASAQREPREPRQPRGPLDKERERKQLEDYPWLDIHMEAQTGKRQRRRTGKAARRPKTKPRPAPAVIISDYSDSEAEVPVVPETLSDIAARLACERKDLSVDLLDVLDFAIKIQGGGWTIRHKGTLTDIAQGHTKGKDAETWAQTYKWVRYPVFTFKKYGQQNSIWLCIEWCRRSQYYYDIFQSMGRGSYAYDIVDHDGYFEDSGYLDWAKSMCDDESVQGNNSYVRMAELRRMRPVNPA